MDIISTIISAISLFLSILVSYFAYFHKGRLYFSKPSKIGIRLHDHIMLCLPLTIVNSGVLSKVINRMVAQINPLNKKKDIIVLEAAFLWDQFPPGPNTVYEAISPIVIPARSSTQKNIGLYARNNIQVLKDNHYEFILYANYNNERSNKEKSEEILRFNFEGSYIPEIRLGRYEKMGKWHFLFSDHNDPFLWKLYKKANIKAKLK